jgi:hypothetical protein
VTDRKHQSQKVRALYWSLAIALGALRAWPAALNHSMNEDGISYLDVADAYLRGDWAGAINGYWSPLYSWLLGIAMHLLKPSPYWQFSIVHMVNFLIYLSALICFDFFWREFMRLRREASARNSNGGLTTLPEWAWLALGYALFLWSSLNLIKIWAVTPDMCVAAFVYLAAALLIRIRRGLARWTTFALLGGVLGLGYLAKAPMFPLAFVFLAVALFSAGDLRRAAPRALIALGVFLLVAGPYLVTLSLYKERVTFGDSGRLNYARYVNGLPHLHWQGDLAGNGVPRHPTRKLADSPAVYEFAMPLAATYPVWYDPSYWYEGVVPQFNLQQQGKALLANAAKYCDLFSRLQGGLLTGVFILYMMRGRSRWWGLKDGAAYWSLLIPALAAFAMYALVYVEPRYVASFVVLFWSGVLAGVHLPESQKVVKFATGVSVIILLVVVINIVPFNVKRLFNLQGIRTPTSSDIPRNSTNQAKPLNRRSHLQWQIAQGLSSIGVQAGDKVASIGYSFAAFWARLARVRIIAEIPSHDAEKFWTAAPPVQAYIIQIFADTGATVIVAEEAPDSAIQAGWQRIGTTSHFAYILPK